MMTNRPKLLFLTGYFPPLNHTACVRTRNLAKYVARTGWDVTVVTPRPDVWRGVENAAAVDAELAKEGILRIGTGFRWRCLQPGRLNCWNTGLGWVAGGICRRALQRLERYTDVDSWSGWIAEAEKACVPLRPEDVDVILATGSPFRTFALARRLARRLGRPYVLDYRDLWTGNPYTMYLDRPRTVRQETQVLRDSAAVTTVSSSCASSLDSRFDLGSKLHVVTNGYDPDEMAKVEGYPFDHFAIVYTGIFIPPTRVITPLLAALQQIKSNVNWMFHYYGPEGEHVHEEAHRFGIRDQVILHGQVPRKEVLSAVRGANIAVVVTSVAAKGTLEDKGIVTGKIFEPIGLGTPILLITPPGSDASEIAGRAGGACCVSGNNIEGIVSFILDVMSGRVPAVKEPSLYSWATIGCTLDTVLQEAMAQRSGSCRV
jgi:glycosyltransferase involved in cell wall biosynthesis